MNIKDRKEEVNFSDKLDVLKYVGDIKLRLRNDISSDFILAKLEDKDKEAIIEMTSNAYFSKKLILLIVEKAKKMNYPMSAEEEKLMKSKANAVFDEYMKRIYMTVILNRNVDGNYIVNRLSEYNPSDEREITGEPSKAMEAVKNMAGEKVEDSKK